MRTVQCTLALTVRLPRSVIEVVRIKSGSPVDIKPVGNLHSCWGKEVMFWWFMAYLKKLRWQQLRLSWTLRRQLMQHTLQARSYKVSFALSGASLYL